MTLPKVFLSHIWIDSDNNIDSDSDGDGDRNTGGDSDSDSDSDNNRNSQGWRFLSLSRWGCRRMVRFPGKESFVMKEKCLVGRIGNLRVSSSSMGSEYQ
jgi:hypothetical protein